MKKFILISALSIFSMNSFAGFSLTCPEIYQRVMVAKEIKKDKASRVAYATNAAALVSSLSIPVIGVVMLAPGVALNIYSAIDSKEDRILRLSKEGGRELSRLTKKLQKSINANISEEEVMEVVQQGLESGHYCVAFPDLFTPKEVKEHVEKVLEYKYSSNQEF